MNLPPLPSSQSPSCRPPHGSPEPRRPREVRKAESIVSKPFCRFPFTFSKTNIKFLETGSLKSINQTESNTMEVRGKEKLRVVQQVPTYLVSTKNHAPSRIRGCGWPNEIVIGRKASWSRNIVSMPCFQSLEIQQVLSCSQLSFQR